MLNQRVLLQGVDAQVLAIAGLLETSMRHLGDLAHVVVDPNHSEPQLAGNPEGASDISRPDRGRKPVLRRVRPLDYLLLVTEWLNGEHGAEDLLLDHLAVRGQARDDRRLDELAGPVGHRPASHDLAAVHAVEKAQHSLALPR